MSNTLTLNDARVVGASSMPLFESISAGETTLVAPWALVKGGMIVLLVPPVDPWTDEALEAGYKALAQSLDLEDDAAVAALRERRARASAD